MEGKGKKYGHYVWNCLRLWPLSKTNSEQWNPSYAKDECAKIKITLGLLRKSMTPHHLEATLFSKVNKELWDAKLVSKMAIIYFS